jgi:hypothetical protein
MGSGGSDGFSGIWLVICTEFPDSLLGSGGFSDSSGGVVSLTEGPVDSVLLSSL